MNGLDRLLSSGFFPRPTARVGLLAHAASMAEDGRHAVQALLEDSPWELSCLFSPEHGFDSRAAAGEEVGSGTHADSGLPLYSLYGEHRSPPRDWLNGLDLLVCDLQDLGVRCYTYASTLDNVLRVASDMRVPVLVLDRATPLAGWSDGPGLDAPCRSFVGQIDLPLVYGLSQGPLAEHLQASLPALRQLELEVIPADPFHEDQPWHPPSPAIPSIESARLYPMTVWCEAIDQVSVHRARSDAFQIWAMPDWNPSALLPMTLPGIEAHLDRSEEEWPALRFRRIPGMPCLPVTAAERLLVAIGKQLGAERLFGAGCRPEFFDKLAGTSSFRMRILEQIS